MPRTLLVLSLAVLAVSPSACAVFSPVSSGMDEMQVQSRLGKPETVRKNSDGSATWEYPGGPLGRQTYMVTMGSDHVVKNVRQVLREEYFSQVTAGMPRDDVRRLLGKPGEVSVYPARDEEVWSWRYQEQNPMFFNVMFDRSSGTVRSIQRMEEILFMDQDM
jgi:outer membrane protein assembly factor BamE (lipoprotein component of BamABCDE complex)